MRRSNYRIISANEREVVLEDVGPWDQHPSVTNDIEQVVRDLWIKGYLNKDSVKLFYYDTDGEKTQVIHKDGFFVTWKFPATGKEMQT